MTVLRYPMAIRYDFFWVPFFFFFFSVFFFRESFASFTRGTRGIPCKVQPPSARYPRRQNPEEASGAEKNCQTVVTSATVCRWLMAVIFLRIRMTQGSVIQSSLYINTDPPTCVCVYVRVVDVSAFTASGTDAARTFYRRISADLRPSSWKL